MAGLKFCSDRGVSWYRAIKLTQIARSARNDLKKLADRTTKTEDKLVEVLENTSSDLKSSSQSSTEISSTVNQANRNCRFSWLYLSRYSSGKPFVMDLNFFTPKESIDQNKIKFLSS